MTKLREERLNRPTCFRRDLVREAGEVLLFVDRPAADYTPAGTDDGARDAERFGAVHACRIYYSGPEDELRAELARLGGRYNP